MIPVQATCSSCGLTGLLRRRGTPKVLCDDCKRKKKSEWSKARSAERRKIHPDYELKKKRDSLNTVFCRVCGEVFSYQGRIHREYCSTSCFYKRNTGKDGSRKCSKCLIVMPQERFTPTKSSCKECCVKASQEYYSKLKSENQISYYCHRSAANYAGPEGQQVLRLSLEKMLGDAIAGGVCPYCKISICIRTFSFDHITPRSRGGSESDPKNIHVTCLRCNMMKGNIGHEAFLLLKMFLVDLGEEERRIIEARLLSGNSRFMRKG